MGMPNVVRDAITGWMRDQSPEQIQRWAMTHEDLLPVLQRTYRNQMQLMKLFLTQRDKTAMRHLKTKDWDTLLNHLVTNAGDNGLILWQHKDWYYAQMHQVQNHVMAIIE